MARKKHDTFQEDADTAAVEAEVADDGYDEPLDGDAPTVEPTLTEHPEVNITKPEPSETAPKLSETTKAEMETGRKTLEERAKSKQAETGEPGETA